MAKRHKGGFKVKATKKMEHEYKHKGGKRRSRKRSGK